MQRRIGRGRSLFPLKCLESLEGRLLASCIRWRGGLGVRASGPHGLLGQAAVRRLHWKDGRFFPGRAVCRPSDVEKHEPSKADDWLRHKDNRRHAVG